MIYNQILSSISYYINITIESFPPDLYKAPNIVQQMVSAFSRGMRKNPRFMSDDNFESRKRINDHAPFDEMYTPLRVPRYVVLIGDKQTVVWPTSLRTVCIGRSSLATTKHPLFLSLSRSH